MMAFARALGAEIVKLRRTLALWLAIVMPLGAVALQVLVFCQRGAYLYQVEDAWVRFGQQLFVFWALLFLPLFVTLETALLAGLEHGGAHWKHLYVLPLPRWSIYAVKQATGTSLIALSNVALVVFCLVVGLLLRLALPGAGFESAVPWGTYLRYTAAISLAPWLIVSIHTWISLRWKSFVVACAAGILLTLSGMVAVNAEWGSFYPWAIAGLIANNFNKGMDLPLAELLFGCLGGVLIAPLACWDVTRRDVF